MKSNPDNDIQRTTDIGLFNYANSYWNAAAALGEIKLDSTHPDQPVYFLYYHAIELYLKFFLLFNGCTTSQLKEFGHSVSHLKNQTEKLGLVFNDEDVDSLELIANQDAIIRSRYLEYGYVQWPTLKALNRMCRRLHHAVGTKLKDGGIHVRNL